MQKDAKKTEKRCKYYLYTELLHSHYSAVPIKEKLEIVNCYKLFRCWRGIVNTVNEI